MALGPGSSSPARLVYRRGIALLAGSCLAKYHRRSLCGSETINFYAPAVAKYQIFAKISNFNMADTTTAPASQDAAPKVPQKGQWTTGMLDIADDPLTGTKRESMCSVTATNCCRNSLSSTSRSRIAIWAFVAIVLLPGVGSSLYKQQKHAILGTCLM